MHILSVLFFPGNAEADVGEVGNWTTIWWPFVSWICVPKIIKLDNPSSRYGQKNLVCFYAPQCMLNVQSANRVHYWLNMQNT